MTTNNQKFSSGEQNQIPADERFLRLPQILGDENHPPIIPVSKSTWWSGIREGIFPAPIHLGKRVTVWRKSDIDALMNR